MVQNLFDHLLPRAQRQKPAARRASTHCSSNYGFDRVQHEQIQADLRAGRIGLAQNRLPASSRHRGRRAPAMCRCMATCRDAIASSACRRWRDGDGRGGHAGRRRRAAAGPRARAWSRRCNPFCQARRHATAPSSKSTWPRAAASAASAARCCRTSSPPATSPTSHRAAISRRESNYGYPGPLLLSPGRTIGLRMVPMERDLRFAWEEMPQQMLDEQAQKVRESLHAALIGWARQAGEGSDYTDNLPAAVPASGRPLVRSAEPAAQRRAGAAAGRAAAAAVPDAAQHRHRWARMSTPALLGLAHRAAARR